MTPKPVFARVVRRKAVTILAGFKCSGGIVICADTQETIEHSKRRVPKLKVEKPPHWDGHGGILPSDLAVAFCGAGEGPMIDKLTNYAWGQMKHAPSMDEACERAEDAIKFVYKDLGSIYQAGRCPEVELIYGVKMDGESKLFTASGPIVNECDGFASQGIGGYMADFLAGRMYRPYLNYRQGVILAAYILFQAKEHVDGCGGESHIAILRDDESCGMVDSELVKEMTDALKFADLMTGEMLMDSADLEMDTTTFNERTARWVENLRFNREHHSKALQDGKLLNLRSLMGFRNNDDFFGLPKTIKPEPDEDATPSNPEK